MNFIFGLISFNMVCASPARTLVSIAIHTVCIVLPMGKNNKHAQKTIDKSTELNIRSDVLIYLTAILFFIHVLVL